MTRRDKLLAAIRANPKGVRFADARKAAETIGYIPPYQARLLIDMLDKYEG